jgi:hypothetical protein
MINAMGQSFWACSRTDVIQQESKRFSNSCLHITFADRERRVLAAVCRIRDVAPAYDSPALCYQEENFTSENLSSARVSTNKSTKSLSNEEPVPNGMLTIATGREGQG